MQWKWFAQWSSTTNSFYAAPNGAMVAGKRHAVRMNREILGLEYSDKRHGDHQNRNTLDNRRNNLRIATPSQNRCNCGRQVNNTSGFKGVFWHKAAGKWRAQIRIDRHSQHLGMFDTPEVAAEAYDFAAIALHGEFAKINFPKGEAR